METLRVIRCEHPEGKRAYLAMCYELDMGDWEDLPNPYKDIPDFGELEVGHVCAALPETLDLWFPMPLREAMRSLGFRFVVLDLPAHKHWRGRYQAVFDRTHATEVEEYVQ